MNITFINDVLSMRVWMSISSMLPLIYVIDRAIDNRTKVPSMKRTKKRYLATEIHRRAFTLQNRVQRRNHILAEPVSRIACEYHKLVYLYCSTDILSVSQHICIFRSTTRESL